MGSAITEFNAWVAATAPHRMGNAQDIINDSGRRELFVDQLLAGSDDSFVSDAGQYGFSLSRLRKSNLSGTYKIGDRFTAPNPQNLDTPKSYWRFLKTSFGYWEEQLELNGTLGSPEKWADFIYNLRMEAAQDSMEDLDDRIWRAPDTTNEDATGEGFHSIREAITYDGLMPSGFSTVWGISSTTRPRWRNQVETYGVSTFSTTYFAAFMDMTLKLRWQTPVSPQAWFQNTNLQDMIIASDAAGVSLYAETLYEANAGRMIPQADPGLAYASPKGTGSPGMQYWHNIPIQVVNPLTTIAYPKPRFYWIDRKYLNIMRHPRKWMVEDAPKDGGIEYPNGYGVHTRSYGNLHCKSRDRLGLILADNDTQT
jgi:hypothetical protein